MPQYLKKGIFTNTPTIPRAVKASLYRSQPSISKKGRKKHEKRTKKKAEKEREDIFIKIAIPKTLHPNSISYKFAGNYVNRQKKFRGQHDFSAKKFAGYKYFLYLCPEFQRENHGTSFQTQNLPRLIGLEDHGKWSYCHHGGGCPPRRLYTQL